jgi:SulP family sulfate permease
MMRDVENSWLKQNIKRVRRYFRGKFRADLTAGLTVTMVVIPQAMAYASILGISPIFGLFTAIVPTIISGIFSRFPYLMIGPTNPTALVTASVLVGYASQRNYVEFVFAVAIIAGIFNIVFGLIKLGSLTKYISNSVLVGFLTGVGILVISYQVSNLFGLQFQGVNNLWDLVKQFAKSLPQINFLSLFISLISFGLLILLRKVNKKLPASLITIVITGLLVYFTGWHQSGGVKIVSDIGLPDRISLEFHIPKIDLREYLNLIGAGAAVALFSAMESLSIAKAISQMTGKAIEPSQQLISQGAASFVGGFFNCMPSSTSPSRSIINVVNGAKSRASAILSGLSVLIFMLLFSNLIGYIPTATLASIVIFSAAGLINMNLIKLTWQSRSKSRVGMIITFVSTLVLPLEYAIYLGILSTILIYLGESSRVNLNGIIEDSNGKYLEVPIEDLKMQQPPIAIINIEGDLYFAAAENLQEQLTKILETKIQVLILRFRRTHLLASTGIMAIDQLLKTARDKDVKLLFCGIMEETYEPLKAAGVVDIIGEENIFTAHDTLFDSTQRALQRARMILQQNQSTK